MSSNGHILFISINRDLYILDRDLNIIKQKQPSMVFVHDICWSKTLDQFIVIVGRTISTLNIDLMDLMVMEFDFDEA